jgi:hypothetical protein
MEICFAKLFCSEYDISHIFTIFSPLKEKIGKIAYSHASWILTNDTSNESP